MPKQQRVDNNIYQYISPNEVTDFTVVEVRDWILEHSDMYGNKNNAGLFVTRQLQSLKEAGLITQKRAGRKATYFKSDRFFEANFKLVSKKRRKRSTQKPIMQQKKHIVVELENEKTNIEAELAITLAEVNEYKVLMARSNDLNKLLKPSCSERAQKAAVLMAKLNVWTSTIELIRLNRSELC